MTLIELMVVVVILVTLVAGVLPLISPNNDARKIREASRGLKTFLMMAQAEAARTGRPVGVGFRESSSGSGVALEAFQLAVPPEYAGSSPESRVGINPTGQTYPQIPNGKPARFSSSVQGHLNPSYNGRDFAGARLYEVQSRLATKDAANNVQMDPLPPRMFRVGDVINADGKRFIIVDDKRHKEVQLIPGDQNSAKYLDPPNNLAGFENRLICVWLDEVDQGIGQVPPLADPNAVYRYRIARQPAGGATANPFTISTQPAFQFPAGIGIDLNGSGFERSGEMFFFKNPTGLNNPPPVSSGILFSPSGDIESVWQGFYQITDADRVFFLVGRGENGSFQSDNENYTNQTDWYVDANMSDDELSDLRTKINWLHPESRWLLIERTATRLQVAENAVYDPRIGDAWDEMNSAVDARTKKRSAAAVKGVQVEHAHELAHGLSDGGR